MNFLTESGKEIYRVKGNCDYYDGFDEELIFELEGVKILLSHGNIYGVKHSYDALAAKAVECGADIAIFGHTHDAFRANVFGAFLFNPGSINPYNAARFPSYGIIETGGADILRADIINIV